MTSVLLGLTGLDQDRTNAQPHPPGRELRETSQRTSSERRTVVRQNTIRKTELPEKTQKYRLCLVYPGREQPLATEQVAGIAVRHRQGITVATVSCFELTLEIRSPHLVRFYRYLCLIARVPNLRTTAALDNQFRGEPRWHYTSIGPVAEPQETERTRSSAASSGPSPFCLRSSTIAATISLGVSSGQW